MAGSQSKTDAELIAEAIKSGRVVRIKEGERSIPVVEKTKKDPKYGPETCRAGRPVGRHQTLSELDSEWEG